MGGWRAVAALVSTDPADVAGERVLVTGASGLLGSALVPALQQRGAAVVVPGPPLHARAPREARVL